MAAADETNACTAVHNACQTICSELQLATKLALEMESKIIFEYSLHHRKYHTVLHLNGGVCSSAWLISTPQAKCFMQKCCR